MELRSEYVAPLAGAWIEIHESLTDDAEIEVAPLAGARIEICKEETPFLIAPLRERGLKYVCENKRRTYLQSLPSWERRATLLHQILMRRYKLWMRDFSL